MHYSHIAAYYDWCYRTGVKTCHQRNSLSAIAFEYSLASKDAKFADKFFQYK